MQLGPILRQLLSRHPKVSVPGIGLLQKKRIPARFDAQKNAFLPPGYTYILFSDEGTDSYLLAHFVQETDTAEKAREQLSIALNALKNEVQEQGKASLGPLGSLSQRDGTYVLSSTDHFLGLAAVEEHIKPLPAPPQPAEAEIIQGPVPDDQPIAPIQDNPSAPEDSVDDGGNKYGGDNVADPYTLENDTIPLSTLDTTEEQQKRSNATRIVLWSIAFLALIAVGAYAYILQKKKANDQAVSSDMVPQQGNASEPAEILLPDTAYNNGQDSIIADTIAAIENTEPTQAPSLVRSVDPEKPYNVIIGSLPNIRLALEEVENLKKKGVDCFVLESNMPNNRKRISYGSYATFEEAEEIAKKVKREVNKDAFVHPMEKIK